MSRKSRHLQNDSTAGNASRDQIISLFNSVAEHASENQLQKAQMREEQFSEEPIEAKQTLSSRLSYLKEDWKKRVLYPVLGVALLAMLCLGAMASNGWLPRADALSGKTTGWFGKEIKANNNASSSSSTALAATSAPAAAAAVTTSTPLLSKEYIYAGSRMLAVEDAGASAVPPADLAVWRPSSGTWYVINSNQQWTVQQWGANGDIPSPGDYDGDGKTDFCVFRPTDTPSSAAWYISYTSTGAFVGFPLGINGDRPAPADYDGDGKTDAGVYRPSNGVWYFIRSSDQVVSYVQFGLSTDVPAPADYDGDGRADIGVYRGSGLTFYSLKNSDGTLVITPLGQVTTDKPVSADYDGDGRADYAVREGANWIIKQSSNNQTQTIAWQLESDQAVQNDYDGDGKVDVAVWRDATGVWYIRNSRDLTTRTQQWGQTGDVPVPAFYRR